MRNVIVILSFLLLSAMHTNCAAAASLLKLEDKQQSYQGKLAAADKKICWLLGEDGQLQRVVLPNVVRYEKAKRPFRPVSNRVLRDKLQREWGSDFEVTGTQHYLVCAAKGQSRQYTQLFEKVYRSFYVYFSARGFQLQEPEFPLVAIVFPNHNGFRDYCLKDKIRPTNTLKGYYLRTSNRVALFNSGQRLAAGSANKIRSRYYDLPTTFTRDSAQPIASAVRHITVQQSDRITPIYATVEADLKQTIIHEAVHQVAFNTGLHSRIGETPKWVIEGLAMVMESGGTWDRSSDQKSRINRQRYLWFREYLKTRRPKQALRKFLSSDDLFQSSTLDAYAEAWALTFFLLETRPAKYEQYLKHIQKNDPLKSYPGTQRVADFKKIFGNDLDWLNTNYLRFINRL